MKVYDTSGVPVFTREGVVSLDPKEITAIVETGILLDKLEASRVQFSWLGEAEGWVRATAQPLELDVSGETIDVTGLMPRVTAKLRNPTLETFREFEVAAIVYGQSGNAIAVSRTYIDRIAPNEERDVVFSWPKPFTETAVEAEVLPKI